MKIIELITTYPISFLMFIGMFFALIFTIREERKRKKK
jgi:preprotein translocase subunit YajC